MILVRESGSMAYSKTQQFIQYADPQYRFGGGQPCRIDADVRHFKRHK